MDDDLSPSFSYYDPISLTNNPEDHEPWRGYTMNNNFLQFSGNGADSMEESASLRSHPSRSSHADQALLPRSQAAAPPTPSLSRAKTRSQPQRLQRRRSHYYYYVDGVLVPATALFAQLESQGQAQVQVPLITGGTGATGHNTAMTTTTTPPPLPLIPGAAVPPTTAEPSSPPTNPTFPPQSTSSSPHHKRAKSYGIVGSAASAWLLPNNSSIPSENTTKRPAWTGERRESRKLHKDHPVGSARPAFGVALGDGPPDMDRNNEHDYTTTAGGGGGGGLLGGSGGTLSRASSVLGVRRKMEKLKKGLYRRGSKEAVIAPGLR